ncbi:MAG: 50S ribosomal protein L11 methyltransferase [Hyphomicrobiaceae bacterium]|nr:50S ribosomal protein L11 methyltransferase [Hyphomicrobiaceae bacterium]
MTAHDEVPPGAAVVDDECSGAAVVGGGASAGVVVRIETDSRDAARRIGGAAQDLVDPPPDALSLFEVAGVPGRWRIEAYYTEAPDLDELGTTLEAASGVTVGRLTIEPVPQRNWVAISQAALPPVAAGRFTVHGSHDRHRVPQGPNALLIEAGEAFGTAHHATTYGCLMAIDRLTRRGRPKRILDLGCGSGVLAIACARALPAARILASDLDRQSVLVAAENCRVNRVGRRVGAIVAAGLADSAIRSAAPFDLIIANILAGPLVTLAPSIARALAPNGRVVLSGLLIEQARDVIATYRAAGLHLETHQRIAGWSTLVMVKAAGRMPDGDETSRPVRRRQRLPVGKTRRAR